MAMGLMADAGPVVLLLSGRVSPFCAPVWLALASGICLFVGVLLVYAARTMLQDAAHTRSLPVLGRVGLEQCRPGDAALVVGRISPTMQPRYQTLVAYAREYRKTTYHRGSRRREWVIDELVTPPLLLETASGPVQMVASEHRRRRPTRVESNGGRGYYLFDPLGRCSSYALYKPSATISAGEGRRYHGFRVNDAVLAFGTATRTSAGMVLDARLVYGGTKQRYIDSQRRDARRTFLVSLIPFGMSIMFLIASGFTLLSP